MSQQHLKPLNKKVGALSADGDNLYREDTREMYQDDRIDADQVRNNQGLEEGYGLSNLANIQEEHARDRIGGEVISERERETDRESSPPGTIGDYQEVRSENVKFTQGLKKKNMSKPTATAGHHQNGSDDEEDHSVRALKSELTKQTAVAIVSPTIAINETSRAMECFNSNYELLFRDFKVQLVEQYRQMRDLYMNEYQENYDQNTSRTEDRISDAKQSIDDKESHIRTLEKNQANQKSMLQRFFTMKYHGSINKKAWRAWFAYHLFEKSKKRKENFAINKISRKRKLLLFGSWRGVTHKAFKERCETDKEVFREELNQKHLVQWSTRVDSLLLYMAQLEEKIK